jgi:hypothetical protein
MPFPSVASPAATSLGHVDVARRDGQIGSRERWICDRHSVAVDVCWEIKQHLLFRQMNTIIDLNRILYK